jgi:hypothetical protein
MTIVKYYFIGLRPTFQNTILFMTSIGDVKSISNNSQKVLPKSYLRSD